MISLESILKTNESLTQKRLEFYTLFKIYINSNSTLPNNSQITLDIHRLPSYFYTSQNKPIFDQNISILLQIITEYYFAQKQTQTVHFQYIQGMHEIVATALHIINFNTTSQNFIQILADSYILSVKMIDSLENLLFSDSKISEFSEKVRQKIRQNDYEIYQLIECSNQCYQGFLVKSVFCAFSRDFDIEEIFAIWQLILQKNDELFLVDVTSDIIIYKIQQEPQVNIALFKSILTPVRYIVGRYQGVNLHEEIVWNGICERSSVSELQCQVELSLALIEQVNDILERQSASEIDYLLAFKNIRNMIASKDYSTVQECLVSKDVLENSLQTIQLNYYLINSKYKFIFDQVQD